MRLIKVVGVVTVAAAVVTGVAGAFKILVEPLPRGVVGTPYSYTFKPIGGAPPYTYWFLAGVLPPGLSISSDGQLTGTPTAAGTYAFDVNGHESSGKDTQASFTLTVLEKLTVTTNALKSATVGSPYTATLTASGGGELRWWVSAGVLPDGLTLASNGTISGTPTAAGSSTFTVTVSDGGLRSDTKQLTLLVAAPLAVAAGELPPAVAGKPFMAPPLTATGGVPPYAWSLAGGTLPPGLSLDSASGVVSGTPTAPGTFPLTVGVADSECRTATLDLTATVVRALELVTTRIRAAKAGRPYATKFLARGGVPPRTWKVVRGRLPVGFRLGAATGVLSGTARKPGVFRFTVRVTDSIRESSVRTFVLSVGP